MALRKIYSILFLAVISFISKAQVADTTFKNEWLGIDTMIVAHDMTKSALDKVNILYQKAKKQNLQAQVIKCLLYQYSLQERITTQDPNPVLKNIEKELADSKDDIQKAILHSLIAKLYKEYFETHRWNLYGRKKTAGINKEDITTWGLDDFTTAITKHYQFSLSKPELLKQNSTSPYQAVILKGNISGNSTLFDLLAHEALDYFKTGEANISKPIDAFILNDSASLSNTDQFMKAVFTTKDSSSQTWISLRLFQQLLSAHRNDSDKNLFIETDLERIEWVYGKAAFPGKINSYQKTLSEITETYNKFPASSQAWFLLAKLESDKAAGYSPFRDTTNQYSYLKAMKLIETALSFFNENNRGVVNLKNLLTDVSRKELRTRTESVNIPAKPFRALVQYRNIDTLYCRIIKVSDYTNRNLERQDKNNWKNLCKLKPYRTESISLPTKGDYQLHSVEIKMESLPVGEYLLLTSDNSGFQDSIGKIGSQFFQVSNISFIRNKNDFFVLSRDNGQPIENAKVTVLKNEYNRDLKKWEESTQGVTTSNSNGYFKYSPKKTTEDIRLILKKGNDKLSQEGTNYITDELEGDDDEKNFEKNNRKMFFFTDRSIYRPGQSVFFKAIAVTRDFKTKLSKLIPQKDTGWVYLNDVNGKKIDSVRFSLNEYGSISGKFQLPLNGLTGKFSLITKSYDEISNIISVEEYKRPTFQITFDKTKGSYRLNDSITITGHAISYSGSKIAEAKVVYSIKRFSRYLNPYNTSRRPLFENNREISHGEIKTDSYGKFSITFIALADDIADRAGNPVFEFSISTDITDISGETRSNNMQVSVGYAALLLKLATPELSEADSIKSVSILTTNFSQEKEPAIVKIKIFLLQAPEHPIRKRYWPKPDLHIMSKKEFFSYFPSDEYDEESDFRTWTVDRLVTEGEINTNEKEKFDITALSLKAGYYKIEALTKDKYGEEVKSIQFIQLFNSSKNEWLNAAYQFKYIVNNSVEPGQTASFICGHSTDNLFVIRRTLRSGNKVSDYHFTKNNKGLETIKFIPDEADRGGASILEAYVFDNRIYTYQYDIDVPWNNKTLQVNYESFRNKTEPGSKEKWTINVQTDNNSKIAAELLTGMYDASLDQFSEHDWSAPGIWQENRFQNNFTGISNFGENSSNENYIPLNYLTAGYIEYDHLANNGIELANLNLFKWLNDTTLVLTISLKQSLGALDDAVVVGMGPSKKNNLTAANIKIRGMSSLGQNKLEGKVAGLQIVSDKAIVYNFSEKTGNEEIRRAAKEKSEEDKNGSFVLRKNFNETAFFFPQLYADSSGKYSFSFTMPEALTEWKWMSVAHTKDLAFGTYSTNIVTQKQLMVQPNAPRFLREGDVMEFSAKIVNLSDKEMTGQVSFELVDAATNTSVDGWFQNVFPSQYFTVEAGKSFPVKFPLQVPFSFNRPLTWRIIAKAGEFSDGEENTLPVLTNRVLITESLPLFLPSDTTQSFKFDKLINTESESLSHEGITVEYTSNPVWYAVQALPYLMEYPYECAEQTFNRFYANTLASFIVNKDQKIKQVFEQWKADSSSLKSNLQKNEELKQVLLQETPWVMQAESEEQQKKNIALLFDMVRLSTQTESLIEKLSQLQLPDGSFSWFKGGYADRYMTNYILTGIGKLKRLGALSSDVSLRIRNILVNAIKYSDSKLAEDYNWLIKNKADLTKQQISGTQIEYLYMRSFFRDIAQQSQQAYDFYYKQGKQFWIKQNSYYRAQLGLVSFRNKDEKFATATILPALLENTVSDNKLGMYWKTTYTGNWYQSPIEHQSMMIAFMSEINTNESLTKNINAMKTWLLLNKQTSNWKTTVATADACYALLLNGTDWLNTERKITIQLGKYTINSSSEKTNAGTGYFKKRIEGNQVTPAMGNIALSTNKSISQSPSWGSVYWQYFEDMDKVTASASPLSISKKLFVEKNTDNGKLLELIKEGDELKTGDKVVIRMELRSDRDMDYLHLKDMRASSMEPVNVLSSFKWQDGLGYYESTKDASSNFFISHLSKGTYVFEYPVFITHTGLFSVGLATIQCMYAPEFTSHSESVKIRVAE